jgi:DNA polymerase III epsilon subunit-like protein
MSPDGNVIDKKSLIVKPDGFTIPEHAAKIHRVTTERALIEGKPIREVLSGFVQHLNAASQLVAHNISFDEKVVGAELIRLGYQNMIPAKERICTMHKSTAYCAIPNANGRKGNKWPKLSELYQKLFGEQFEEAHDAGADIEATAKCFFELKRRGVI